MEFKINSRNIVWNEKAKNKEEKMGKNSGKIDKKWQKMKKRQKI